MAMAAPPSSGPPPTSDTNLIVSIAIPDALVLLAGLGLIAASQWQTKIIPVWDLLMNGKIDETTKPVAGELLGEVAFVFILAILAGTSPAMSQLVFAFIFGLWLLWMVKNPGGLKAIVSLPGTVAQPGIQQKQ